MSGAIRAPWAAVLANRSNAPSVPGGSPRPPGLGLEAKKGGKRIIFASRLENYGVCWRRSRITDMLASLQVWLLSMRLRKSLGMRLFALVMIRAAYFAHPSVRGS